MAIFCDYKDEQLYFHHSATRHPQDSEFRMHIHEQFEIFYFISGDAAYLVEGSEYSLEPGSLLIMQQTESHKVKILADKPYERFSLHFSPAFLDSIDPMHRLLTPFINRMIGQNNLYLPFEFQGNQPLELLEAMCVPVSSVADRRLEIAIHLYPLLGIIRHAFLQKQQHSMESPPLSPAEELVAYINLHLFDDLSLDFLSNHFFLSRSQLGRLFKQATGSSVWDYIIIKRLMAARNKIKSGTPAYAACQQCGFRDYSSFYRAYVQRFGNSPQKDGLDLSHIK